MNNDINSRVYNFLKDCNYYFLSTIDSASNKPRVRPFGTINIFEDKLYIQTGKGKDVAKQIEENNKFEICAFDGKSQWIRISGELISDERITAIQSMLKAYPELSNMYNANNTIVYYFNNAIVRFFAYGKAEETYKL